MKAYRLVAVAGVGLLAACMERSNVVQPRGVEASASAALAKSQPDDEYMSRLVPMVAVSGSTRANLGVGATTLTEGFDNPLGGWKTRWLGVHSNLQNYYVWFHACWSGEPGEDCRGNNWDGLWIADNNNSNGNNSFIRFDAAFAATITSFSIDIGSHFNSTLKVYDKDGAVILTQAIPLGCSNCSYFNPGGNVYSHHSVTSSNGVSGFDIANGEGNIGIDNVSVTTGPSDNTPPVITPTVTGTMGANGWYTSDVDVSWAVTDDESSFTSTGCGPTSVTANTAGVTFTCSAESAGGSATSSVTIKRDATVPAVTPSVAGTLGDNGWYTSNVTVSFAVSAAGPSGVTTDGCDSSVLSVNTTGVTYDCTATTGAGLAGHAAATVKRDADAPVITFAGNTGSYTVDQTVGITCSASDSPSGVASTSCPNVASGPAYSFSLGSNSFSATASDNAGNGASASTSFTVSVTFGSLCNLTQSFVSQAGIANALCQKLDAAAASADRGNQNSKAGQIGAYINQLQAQSGKAISAGNASILIALAQAL